MAPGGGLAGAGAGIASDGTNVYWFMGTFGGAPFTLLECAAAGCAMVPTPIAMNINPAAGLGFFGSAGPNLLVTGGTNLFWPDGSNVQRSPFMTPAASSFHMGTAVNQPSQVATDAAFVYWADAKASMIYKCALGSTCTTPTVVVNLTGTQGGTPEGGVPEAGGTDSGLLAVIQPPQLIAVDTTFIYWTDQSGDINSQLLTGGPPVTILDNFHNPNFPPLPTAILAYDGIVYWVVGLGGGPVTLQVISACPANASCTASPGVYNADPDAVAMATDGTDLYWTEVAPPAVKKCKLGLTCASPTTLVTLGPTYSPGDIAVDSTHTYWLDSPSGEVLEGDK